MTNIVDIITTSHEKKEAARYAEHHAALRDEVTKDKRWRDGRGVTHQLRGIVAYNVSVSSSVVWKPACGYRYNSRVTLAPDWPVTCLACLAATPQAYMCRRCGHPAPEHDDTTCCTCTEQALPVPCAGFDPDYRYPYEPEER